jgi:hypothetical protein
VPAGTRAWVLLDWGVIPQRECGNPHLSLENVERGDCRQRYRFGDVALIPLR